MRRRNTLLSSFFLVLGGLFVFAGAYAAVRWYGGLLAGDTLAALETPFPRIYVISSLGLGAAFIVAGRLAQKRG